MEAQAEQHRSSQVSTSRPGRPPPPNSASAIKFADDIKKSKEKALRLVEKGLSADESRRPAEAKTFYESGLKYVNSILAVDCESLQGTDDQKENAKGIQQSLNKTKLEIEYRLQSLRTPEPAGPSAPPSEDFNSDQPPSYELATSGFAADSEFHYLGDSIMAENYDCTESVIPNATEIFSIPDGVQIFYITPEGNVSAPSYPSSLNIFKFNEQQNSYATTVNPVAFLKVGDWLYPLQPSSSPVLQSHYGAYLFPDVTSSVPGVVVGLMVPDTISIEERHQFEDLIQSLTLLQVEGAPVKTVTTEDITTDESTSSKISKGLITAAEYISWGVEKGTEKAGQLIRYGSIKLKTQLQPVVSPQPIDPRLQNGIRYARKGSHAVVQVSSYLITKLGQATMALAKEAAPHICKHGKKLLPKSLKEASNDEKSKIDGVIEVAASGLKGFGTVYMSLEKAAKVLAKNLANETVEIVSHKFGADAGNLAENTLYTAGNIAMTAHNANNLGVKAIAKRAAKDTGKALLTDISQQQKKMMSSPETDHNPN